MRVINVAVVASTGVGAFGVGTGLFKVLSRRIQMFMLCFKVLSRRIQMFILCSKVLSREEFDFRDIRDVEFLVLVLESKVVSKDKMSLTGL